MGTYSQVMHLNNILTTVVGPCKIISAAVTHVPWLGPNGKPLTDVSAYAAVMDFVNIM